MNGLDKIKEQLPIELKALIYKVNYLEKSVETLRKTENKLRSFFITMKNFIFEINAEKKYISIHGECHNAN